MEVIGFFAANPVTIRTWLRDGRAILRISGRAILFALLVPGWFPSRADGQCTGCANASFAGGVASARVGFVSAAGAFPAEPRLPGLADLIVTADTFSQQALTILFSVSYAKGQLGFPITLPVPGPSRGAVTGDFSGDGMQDILATGSGFPAGLFLVRGHAFGAYEPPENLDPGTATFHLVAGDFNGDGRLDAAATHSSPPNSVRIYLGNGAGGVSATADVPAGPNVTSLSTGDFNADGRTDIVATNGNSNTFSLILGVASPPFPPATNFVVGSNPFSAASADIDGDGDLDLAVSNNEHRLSVLLGTGAGSFSSPVHWAAGPVRDFSVTSRCGIPATAKALSLNVTSTQSSAAGHVTIFPGGTSLPATSTLNYRAGQTRANNATISVGATGDLAAFCSQPAGTVHLILDVNGYFE